MSFYENNKLLDKIGSLKNKLPEKQLIVPDLNASELDITEEFNENASTNEKNPVDKDQTEEDPVEEHAHEKDVVKEVSVQDNATENDVAMEDLVQGHATDDGPNEK